MIKKTGTYLSLFNCSRSNLFCSSRSWSWCCLYCLFFLIAFRIGVIIKNTAIIKIIMYITQNNPDGCFVSVSIICNM